MCIGNHRKMPSGNNCEIYFPVSPNPMLELAINIQRYPEMTQLNNIHIIICSTCSRKFLIPLLQVSLLEVRTCVSAHRHSAHLCPPCPWHRPRHEQSVSYHCHWGTLKSEIRAPGGREGNDIGFVGKSFENLHDIQKNPIVPSSQMTYSIELSVIHTHLKLARPSAYPPPMYIFG